MARAKTGFWTRSLDKVRGVFLHAPPEPAAQTAAKKTAPSTDASKRSSASGAQVEGTDASKAPDDKTPKKKIPAQPWYRHRQRW
jgi:hypothetical protein